MSANGLEPVTSRSYPLAAEPWSLLASIGLNLVLHYHCHGTQTIHISFMPYLQWPVMSVCIVPRLIQLTMYIIRGILQMVHFQVSGSNQSGQLQKSPVHLFEVQMDTMLHA